MSVAEMEVLYRGAGDPGDGHSVADHPVVIGQGSQVWVGSATGVEVG